jgi:dUTP pyrophosphatase
MKIQLKILNKEFYKDRDGVYPWSDNNLPCYATPGSAAIDLVCTEGVTIYPGETKMIHTGIAIWIGSENSGNNRALQGVAGLILPRSGLGGDKGLILANTVGLIDEDYQGELLVKAWNRLGSYLNDIPCVCHSVELKAGDRFCQLLFMPVIKTQWEIVEEFSEDTQRGTGGFNSTGN